MELHLRESEEEEDSTTVVLLGEDLMGDSMGDFTMEGLDTLGEVKVKTRDLLSVSVSYTLVSLSYKYATD